MSRGAPPVAVFDFGKSAPPAHCARILWSTILRSGGPHGRFPCTVWTQAATPFCVVRLCTCRAQPPVSTPCVSVVRHRAVLQRPASSSAQRDSGARGLEAAEEGNDAAEPQRRCPPIHGAVDKNRGTKFPVRCLGGVSSATGGRGFGGQGSGRRCPQLRHCTGPT